MVDWGMHPTRSPVRAQPFTTVLCICRVCDQQCDPQPDITMYDICRSGNCNVILARVLLFGWGTGCSMPSRNTSTGRALQSTQVNSLQPEPCQ